MNIKKDGKNISKFIFIKLLKLGIVVALFYGVAIVIAIVVVILENNIRESVIGIAMLTVNILIITLMNKILKKLEKSYNENFSLPLKNIEHEEELIEGEKCSRCGSNYVEYGYKIDLCFECRTSLSKEKYPKWVLIFIIFIFLIFMTSLYNFPNRMRDRIYLEKGIKYYENKNYKKSEIYFEKIADKYIDNAEIQGKLYVSQAYCNNIVGAFKSYDRLTGKEDKLKKLLIDINRATEYLMKEVK